MQYTLQNVLHYQKLYEVREEHYGKEKWWENAKLRQILNVRKTTVTAQRNIAVVVTVWCAGLFLFSCYFTKWTGIAQSV